MAGNGRVVGMGPGGSHIAVGAAGMKAGSGVGGCSGGVARVELGGGDGGWQVDGDGGSRIGRAGQRQGQTAWGDAMRDQHREEDNDGDVRGATPRVGGKGW